MVFGCVCCCCCCCRRCSQAIDREKLSWLLQLIWIVCVFFALFCRMNTIKSSCIQSYEFYRIFTTVLRCNHHLSRRNPNQTIRIRIFIFLQHTDDFNKENKSEWKLWTENLIFTNSIDLLFVVEVPYKIDAFFLPFWVQFEVQYQNQHFPKKLNSKMYKPLCCPWWCCYIDILMSFGGATIVTTHSQEMRSRNGLSNSLFFSHTLCCCFFRSSSLLLFLLFCVLAWMCTVFSSLLLLQFHSMQTHKCDGVFHEIFVCSLPLCLKHTARQFLIVS